MSLRKVSNIAPNLSHFFFFLLERSLSFAKKMEEYFFKYFFCEQTDEDLKKSNTSTGRGGQLGLRPEQPPAILDFGGLPEP